MAYDSVRQKTVLFGGWNNETWEWDGTNWTQRTPTNSPSSRYDHTMVYDSVRQVTVLFEGYIGTNICSNETWEWDGTNWTLRPEISPPARAGHTMAYDSVRQRTIIFGGSIDSGAGYGLVKNETWERIGTNWSQCSPLTSPPARYRHAMAYDSIRQRTVIFAGNFGGNNDTWEWDGTNWTQMYPTSAPSTRDDHAMAYDSNRQRTVLFGGISGGAFNNETWEWGSSSSSASSGTYVSESITPTGVSSWGVLTFTYNAPANTTFTVDVLNSSDNSVLVTNVSSGTDLSTYSALNGITGIKLCANFATTNTSVTPTLFDWGMCYEGQ
jgi:hypothetical protein